MPILNLTAEDRKLLKKRYFLLWAVFKCLLIGLSILFGFIFIFICIRITKHEIIDNSFSTLSGIFIAAVIFIFYAITTYKKAVPLRIDLEQNQKLVKTGQVKSYKIEKRGKYHAVYKIIFQEKNQPYHEELAIDSKDIRRFRDLTVANKEITINYIPNSYVILHAALKVPLSNLELKEIKQSQIKDNIFAIMAIIIITAVVLGISFLLDKK